MNMQLSRRKLLKSTGALVVSFTFAGKASEVLAQGAASAKPVALNEVDSFLAIDKAGKVTLYTGKVDLGTGVRTALAQMCAEELDVPFNSVSLITGDTQLTPDQGNTWGSLTIQSAGIQIRNASATARNALLEEAAKKLNVKKEDLTIADGVVSGGGKKITYAQLIGGKSFSLKVDEKAKAKDPKNYKLVGKSVARVDIPDKVTGKFTYMQDYRVPGMMHGRVVRPPAYGATLESVDENSIKNIPGVRIVRDKNFLGVVAGSEWNAIRAAQQLKVQWSKAATLPDQGKLWEHVRNTKVIQDQVTSDTGSTKDALAGDSKKISATYDFAVNLHGSIGPSCAISEFKDGKLTSWSASQSTHTLRKQLAQMLGMSPDDVRCIYVEGSGCYGRNGHEDAAGDAAILSKAVGKPVRVQWSRADEHGWEPMGPPTLIDIRRRWIHRATCRLGNLISSFRSRLPAVFLYRSPAPRSQVCRRRMTSPPVTFSRIRRSPTNSPMSAPYAGVWRIRCSGLPGSGRRAACRTPTPTRVSWMNSQRRRRPIRLHSERNISTINAASN